MNQRVLTIRSAADAERYRDAKRVSIRRAIGREIEIPPVKNARRRRKCRQAPAVFLRTYFEEIFSNPFSKTQRKMIDACMSCIETLGWKALAAERGGGKTQISMGLAIYAMVYGLRRFVVLLGKNATEANSHGHDIREKFEDAERFPEFSGDFPEVCTPVQELGGAPQRANMQSYQGRLLRMNWSGERLRFPAVPGSESAGAILLCRGLDSAIRGTQKGGVRPDLVLIDDPETEESAKSQLQTDDLDQRIQRSVTGMAGPNRAMAILYLGTVAHANCVADRYTDPANPDYAAWSGERFPLLEQYPSEWEPEGREGLWQKYIAQYQRDEAGGDKLFTRAHALYKANRAAMDAGSIVSSDYHFKNDPDQRRPDGSTIELSTLQFCMNHIAKVGQESFNTEYQQIPPSHEKPTTVSITRADIMSAVTGRRRGLLPANTVSVDAGIDAGATACHWTVIATAGAATHIIDYGVERVHSPLEMNLVDHDADAAVEEAILLALTGNTEHLLPRLGTGRYWRDPPPQHLPGRRGLQRHRRL